MKSNLKFSYIVFYSLCFATLCYPVSGTPFAYLHAYIFSLLATFNLLIAIKKRNKFDPIVKENKNIPYLVDQHLLDKNA